MWESSSNVQFFHSPLNLCINNYNLTFVSFVLSNAMQCRIFIVKFLFDFTDLRLQVEGQRFNIDEIHLNKQINHLCCCSTVALLFIDSNSFSSISLCLPQSPQLPTLRLCFDFIILFFMQTCSPTYFELRYMFQIGNRAWERKARQKQYQECTKRTASTSQTKLNYIWNAFGCVANFCPAT